MDPSEGSAQGSRWGTVEPGVGSVQASVSGVDLCPTRLSSGSRGETAERDGVSCLQASRELPCRSKACTGIWLLCGTEPPCLPPRCFSNSVMDARPSPVSSPS